jgi:hypothetical protein
VGKTAHPPPISCSENEPAYKWTAFSVLYLEIFASLSYPRYLYSEFFLRLAIGFYILIFQPPVNFCSHENIQTIFGTKLEDFLNYRIDYNSISQTVEKVVKKVFFSCIVVNRYMGRTPTLCVLYKMAAD